MVTATIQIVFWTGVVVAISVVCWCFGGILCYLYLERCCCLLAVLPGFMSGNLSDIPVPELVGVASKVAGVGVIFSEVLGRSRLGENFLSRRCGGDPPEELSRFGQQFGLAC